MRATPLQLHRSRWWWPCPPGTVQPVERTVKHTPPHIGPLLLSGLTCIDFYHLPAFYWLHRPYTAALRRFRRKVLLAAHNDERVPWYSAAMISPHLRNCQNTTTASSYALGESSLLPVSVLCLDRCVYTVLCVLGPRPMPPHHGIRPHTLTAHGPSRHTRRDRLASCS